MDGTPNKFRGSYLDGGSERTTDASMSLIYPQVDGAKSSEVLSFAEQTRSYTMSLHLSKPMLILWLDQCLSP